MLACVCARMSTCVLVTIINKETEAMHVRGRKEGMGGVEGKGQEKVEGKKGNDVIIF